MGKTRVYVGNLPAGVREGDIEDIFRKYGDIANLDLRTNKGPPFAFLEFDSSRDAEDAVRGRDGYEYKGSRIRVEYPHANRDDDRRGGGGSGGGGGRGGYGGDRGFGGGARRNDGGIRHSKYRLAITGLPRSGSWQDLKDHMREAGEVCFADVAKDGTGHVEFLREEDMKYAIKKLDDTKFRSREGETGYIRIKIDDGSSSGSRRRSRSRSGSRDRDRRTRSRSPIRKDRAGSGDANGKERAGSKRDRSASRSPNRRPARGASPTDSKNGAKRERRATRSRSPVTTTRAAARSASPADANGKDRGSAKRERSASRSPDRSVHSKSRSASKSANGSRSPSRERE